ncbi:MAG: hypothetical protein B0A82_23920 [Alkalinema sp. CACIAM 70d]|nr:MAG: hypothetical protein B0A82_23920 [Alkalinema sp. CACIAM 70d]
MHKKTRYSPSVLATVLLFSSLLSGCPSGGIASQGSRLAPKAAPAADDAGRAIARKVAPAADDAERTIARKAAGAADDAERAGGQVTQSVVRSEGEIATAFGVDLSAAKAAKDEYPQVFDEAQRLYAEMVQQSGEQALAKAQDAVQQAADQSNTQIPPEAAYALAGGIVVTYAAANQ